MSNFAAFLINITMKRIILFAFVAFSMSVMAQRVTPLNIHLAEVKLDSLRALYHSEPLMYRAALNTLAASLDKNEAEVKDAKSELKIEQAHAREVASSLKDATQLTTALKKLYSKEEDELKTMQKNIEKQQRTLNKHRALNQDTRLGYMQLLEKEQKEITYALREVAERQRAVTDMEATLHNAHLSLDDFVHETQKKATEIANLETQLKERVAAVKAEQKNAKSMK